MTQRTAVALGAIFGLAIAACFTKPDPPSGLAPVDDGGLVGDGAPPLSCVQYGFGSAPPATCGGWGVVEEGSGSISADQLHLTAPGSSSTTTARCQSGSGSIRRATLDIAVALGPVSVDVARLTFFVLLDGLRYGGELSGSGGTASIQLKCGSGPSMSRPWYTIERYVRLISPLAGRVELQVSTNGSLWDSVGICNVSSGTARVGLEVQRIGAGSALTASFESLEICQ